MNIAPATREDIFALGGSEFHCQSKDAVAIRDHNGVFAVAGVSVIPGIEAAGVMWFAIDDPKKRKREAVAVARLIVRSAADLYSPLYAAPDVGKDNLDGWFRYLGFSLDLEMPPLHINGIETRILRYGGATGGPNSDGSSTP